MSHWQRVRTVTALGSVLGGTLVAAAGGGCAGQTFAARAWRPSLSLAQAPDGTYTLYSVTLTPDACHRAGPVAAGAPSGRIAAASEVPLLRSVSRREDVACPPVIWPVYHVRRGIRQDGREAVHAYALLNGQYVADARARFRDALPDSAWTPELRALFPE